MKKESIDEVEARNDLALPLINQRQSSIRVLELVRLVLLGATVQDLLDIERGLPKCQ